jgi:hypothetical protein
MFIVRCNLIDTLATFETEAEALAFVEALRPIHAEPDGQHPGCWDALLSDGRIISIESRK